MTRGGPIVTVGAALLFLWWAIDGTRPQVGTPRWFGAESEEVSMSVRERLLWALAGLAMILYEVFKFYRLAHAMRQGA